MTLKYQPMSPEEITQALKNTIEHTTKEVEAADPTLGAYARRKADATSGSTNLGEVIKACDYVAQIAAKAKK